MKIRILIVMLTMATNDILQKCNAVPFNFKPSSPNDDRPLLLSPLIQRGQLERARTLSRVHGEQLGMELESYSGYLTARSAPNEAHLFFWFFPALTNPRNAPVILWMNGGPGLTSLSGLFAEIGPYYITKDGRVKRRRVTWLSKFSLIFLDAPAGTGFSFPKSKSSYSNTTKEITDDVHEVLRQFCLVFTEYSHLDFYVTGESYAAKYAIALAHILKASLSSSSSPINLKGIILMSGMFDPVNVIQSSDYLYQTGLVQLKTYEKLAQAMRAFAVLTNANQYVQASQIIGSIIGTDYQPGFFSDETGILGSDNILRDVMSAEFHTYIPFVNGTQRVRRALHAGVETPFYEMTPEVITSIIESGDFARSLRPELQVVLDAGVNVLYVTGNMDYLVVAVGAKQASEALQWKCRDRYLNSTKRIVWRVNADDVHSAGYVKCACNFCTALVRNAGHRLPADEPVRALDLIDRFINNKPF